MKYESSNIYHVVKILPIGIHTLNMKALTLTSQRLWSTLKFYVKNVTLIFDLTLTDGFDLGTTERSYHMDYTY